jgi:hypothetical protein
MAKAEALGAAGNSFFRWGRRANGNAAIEGDSAQNLAPEFYKGARYAQLRRRITVATSSKAGSAGSRLRDWEWLKKTA